jgi:hypothetical protein
VIGEVGGSLGHVATIAGRADAAALAGEGHDESRAARHADRAGEAVAEEPAREIAAEFVLDVSRHGPLGGFPPGEPALGRNALSRDFTRIIGLIEEGRIDTRPWITHEITFADTIAAFPTLLDPASGVIKAVVTL